MELPNAIPAEKIAMKNHLSAVTSVVLLASTLVFAGCATPDPEPAKPAAGISFIQKKQPSPTEDMTGIQKTFYYVGWLSLDCLYGFASSNPSFSP